MSADLVEIYMGRWMRHLHTGKTDKGIGASVGTLGKRGLKRCHLASVVAHAAVLVGEGVQDGGHDAGKVHGAGVAQPHSRRRQAQQPALALVRLRAQRIVLRAREV